VRIIMPSQDTNTIKENYKSAKRFFSDYNINTDEVLKKILQIHISIPCWQLDDVAGLEGVEEITGGGIQATGHYPGKARTWDELKMDLSFVLKMIPGYHRVNVHAMYANTGSKGVDRDKLEPEHFLKWIDWAKDEGIKLDFNGTFFSHPKASSGLTLSSADKKIREFWIQHGIQSRIIGEAIGKALDDRCIVNLWIPDGSKDLPADRLSPRERLKEALDRVFEKKMDKKYMADSVESKLFGIGSEAYVVGSHEFYMGYAMKNDVMLCLDTGHFHPTESIADKISAVLCFSDELLLHLSRGVRWDSDHTVILEDQTLNIAKEINRMNAWKKVNIALDFFDASINRAAALIIGTRAFLKAVLISMLEPVEQLKKEEIKTNYTARLAYMEEYKMFPYSAVWDMFCIHNDVPAGTEWLEEVFRYEKEIMLKRR